MKTISLRYAENFAPECGTIQAHQDMIEKNGYVWYGKMSSPFSNKVITEVLNNEKPKVLLIRSGGKERYWAYIDKIQKETPPLDEIPEYYRNFAETRFKSWLRVIRFEKAPKDIMSYCYVVSSGSSLSTASKHSLNPYAFIEVKEH